MKSWLKYGLIYAIISMISFLLAYYVFNYGLGTQMLVGIVMAIIISILVGREEKKLNGGFISYGHSLKVIFLTLTIGTISALLFMVIMITIDPGLGELMAEQGINASRSMMEVMGAPEDAIEKAMSDAEEQMGGAFGVKNILTNFPTALIMNLIYAAIISLFIKKTDPSANEYL